MALQHSVLDVDEPVLHRPVQEKTDGADLVPAGGTAVDDLPAVARQRVREVCIYCLSDDAVYHGGVSEYRDG